jgi:S1-C subfamily serine protease
MQKKKIFLPVLLVVIAMFASACGSTFAALPAGTTDEIVPEALDLSQGQQEILEAPQVAQQAAPPVDPGLLAAYESTLTELYEQVNPSVVNIRVLGKQMTNLSIPGLDPSFPDIPGHPESGAPLNQSLGSGFVWDKQGHIITNNHVVDDAEVIEVTFSDGTVAEAALVGADPDSDLAVIQVDLPAEALVPVRVSDSEQVRVGQLAIAIGNPFGLDGTMTVGIVSALGRSIPATEGLTGGPVYSIPDVIQTDAPINPGNSGGPLLNASGELIGVTTAIESPVRANAGIGFVIPASIVARVVPELIDDGSFEHPYLGISGVSLFPTLAEAMDLDSDQRGALVAEVIPGGPADKAGLQGSDREASVEGINMGVGGDVIVAINDEPVLEMDDLIAYLSANAAVGQEVTLQVIRDGEEVDIQVRLEARPKNEIQAAAPGQEDENRAWLGILGVPLSAEIAEEMELDQDQSGVLVLEVQPDSPAEIAGLQGGEETVTIDGESIRIGGDVITQADGKDVTTVQELAALFQEVGPGGQVELTVLRDGQTITIDAVLGRQP